MKKFAKLLTTMAVIGGIAAGAYAVYKKYLAPDQDDSFDDDFDEDFDEDDEDEAGEPQRAYVSLNPAQEEEASEETPEATEEEESQEEVIGVSAEAIAEKEVAMADTEKEGTN